MSSINELKNSREYLLSLEPTAEYTAEQIESDLDRVNLEIDMIETASEAFDMLKKRYGDKTDEIIERLDCLTSQDGTEDET